MAQRRIHKQRGSGGSSQYNDGGGVYDAPGHTPDDLSAGKREEAEASVAGADNTLGNIDRALAENQKSFSPETLNGAESSPGGTSASDKNAAANDEKNSIPFREEDVKQKGARGAVKRWKVRRRNAAIGAGTGLLIGGGFGMLTFLAQPFQIIQFAQLLDRFHALPNDEFMGSRTQRLYRYMRYPNNPELRRHGAIMNKYANRIEARWAKDGITPNYDGSGRLASYTVTSEFDTKPFVDDGLTITDNPDGTRTVHMADDNARNRTIRRTNRTISTSSRHNRVLGAMEGRVMSKRAGVKFRLFGNVRRAPNESWLAYSKRIREDMASYRKTGTVTPRLTGTNSSDTVDDNSRQAVEEGNKTIDDTKTAVQDGGVDGGKTHIRNLSKGAGVVGLLCLAQGLSQAQKAIQYSNILLPLIRTGLSIKTMGSQVMAGESLNVEELGAITSRFYTDEEGSWTTAKSIQANLREPQTGPDIPDAARPSKAGEQNAAFSAVNTVFEKIPELNAVCSPAGQIILSVAGGWASVLTDLTIEGLLLVTDFDIVDWLARKIAAEEIESDPAGATLGSYADYGARLANNDAAIAMGAKMLNPEEEFELKQEIRLALKEDFEAMPLSARYFALDEPNSLLSRVARGSPQSATALSNQIASLPVKIFGNIGSGFSGLFSSPAMAQPVEFDYGFPMFGFSADERDSEANDPVAVAGQLKSIFDGRTAAEEECRANPNIPDPWKCEWIPSNLAEFGATYSQCFGASAIENYGPYTMDDGSTEYVHAFRQGQTVNYFDDEYNTDGRCTEGYIDDEEYLVHDAATARNDLRLWRFYLADLVSTHTALCYEGEELSCALLGFNTGEDGETTNGAPGTGVTPGGVIEGDPYTDSTNVACAAGTDDIGVSDAYENGNMFKVRLCSLPNLPSIGQADNPGGPFSTPGAKGFGIVNSRVSGAWFALINEAKSAGISLTGFSTFRSMPHQQALWNTNPNTKDVARPGYSSHQAGVAIDFVGMGVKGGDTCASRARMDSNQAWKWLHDNASRYGFKQYSAEAWHWDAYPAANRC